MKENMKKILGIFFVLFLSPAFGQPVQQSGNVTPGHVTQWITDGVVGDGGPLGGSATLSGMFNAFDFLCANALSNTPLIISCGLSATNPNTWNGIQTFAAVTNLSGGATSITRSPGDSTTNVATTAFVTNAITKAVPPACVSIYAYNGKGDNTTDNTPAYNAAIAALSGAQKCLYFPAGKYKFITTPNAWSTSSSSDSFTIRGDGSDVTELTFPTVGTGFLISLQSTRNSVHLRDFSISTGTTGSGGYALKILHQIGDTDPASDAPSDIIGVTVRGDDSYTLGPTVHYWSTGVETNISNLNWINDYFIGATPAYQTNGKGVILHGAFSGTCTDYSVAHQFIGVIFVTIGTGVELGQCVQGIVFTNCNWTGGSYGINIPAGINGFTQLNVSNSQFNVGTTAINILSNISDTYITYNLFFTPLNGSVGINLGAGTGSYIVQGNIFESVATSGNVNEMVVAEDLTSGVNSVISDNGFHAVIGIGTATTTGLVLTAASKANTVKGNAFSFLTTNIVDSGANNIVYGNNPEYTGYTISGSGTLTQIVCDATRAGRSLFINNGVASPTYNAAVSTTGTSIRSVQCDGTSWAYH